MEMTIRVGSETEVETPLLAVFAVDMAEAKQAGASKPAVASPVLLTAEPQVTRAAAAIMSSGEFKAEAGEVLLVHSPVGLNAQRLLLVGLGKAQKAGLDEVRKGAGTAVLACKPRGIRELALVLPDLSRLEGVSAQQMTAQDVTRVLTEGALLAEPEWDTYRSDRKDRSVHRLDLIAKDDSAEVRRGLEIGRTLAESQNFARSLVNEPGNVLTPTEMGRRAQSMCQEVGLACEVHSTDKLQELGMGAFLAVAQGSAQPPALIVMRYEPESGAAGPDVPMLGLVGKGITFDTGGISIKPADNMEKMKYDMAGAAAMIGAMRAIALLKPRVRVTGIVCSAENMPSGTAYRPGDVVKAMSGTAIEVINTDAEGRMVLADGLHYAKTLGCTHLIDAATLTGACVVALGYLNVGLFSNDEDSTTRFMEGAQKTGEAFWRLPCTENYRDAIKSQIADIVNAGGRAGGAVTAAMFLKEFAGETPWIHLDIAGCAWNEEAKPWLPKGPTGIAVRSIVEWVHAFGGHTQPGKA